MGSRSWICWVPEVGFVDSRSWICWVPEVGFVGSRSWICWAIVGFPKLDLLVPEVGFVGFPKLDFVPKFCAYIYIYTEFKYHGCHPIL